MTAPTPRQMEALALVALGRTNKEIARELGIAEVTVKVLLQGAYKRIGVHNRTQAGVWFHQRHSSGAAPMIPEASS